jgi:solute carrier family 32 (vesicular inhibitory amino acid transporter)
MVNMGSYAGHGVFPSIQAAMRKPEEFPSVLNTAYFVVAGLCTFLGVAGYYMYGSNAMDVITFNLDPGAHSASERSLASSC